MSARITAEGGGPSTPAETPPASTEAATRAVPSSQWANRGTALQMTVHHQHPEHQDGDCKERRCSTAGGVTLARGIGE